MDSFLHLPCAALLALAFIGSARSAPLISEFMASGTGAVIDADGEASDWIEIYNPDQGDADLSGYFLTDDPETLDKWRFPDGATLEPGHYLIVFASGKDRGTAEEEWHTNFRLNNEGEYLALVEPDGATPIHAFAPSFPNQRDGYAYGVDPETGEEKYFKTPTPGGANGAGVTGFVAPPEFSIHRGFYDNAFELTLTCATEGARIRFSTDGDLPTLLNARTYTSPVTIDETTVLRATASAGGMETSPAVTHTYIFVNDVLSQTNVAPPGAHWDTEMDPEVVEDTGQKWSVAEALTSIPTLSVVMKDAHLFGTEGIYKRPDRRDLEYPCSAEYFFPDGYSGHRGGDGFAIDCGIVINGNFSRLTGNPKHSFRLKFKGAYGPTKLRYPLFPERGTDTFDTIAIRTGHNQGWATGHASTQMMRNQFSRDLQGMDPKHLIARGHWIHLYLNGLYWGLYNFHERPDDSFGAENYGGDKEEYDAFKGLRAGGSSQARMIAGNRDAWAELFQRAERDLSVRENYEAILELVDIDQFIDYTIGLLYTGDLDAPTGLGVSATQPKNFYAIRRRTPEGRFRFYRWDSEFTLQNVNEDVSERRGTENPAKLHFELRRNPEYRLRFADRVHRYLYNNGSLTAEPAAAFYLERLAFIDKAIVAESARWGDAQRSLPFTRDVEWVRERDRLTNAWFPRRTEIVLQQFVQDGLYPDLAAPAFAIDGVTAQEGGRIESEERLTITSPDSTIFSSGEIYYTINGGDPRESWTSGVDDDAILYSEPITLPNKAAVQSRVFNSGKGWSALSKATFIVGAKAVEKSEVLISEVHYRPSAPTPQEEEAGYSARSDFEFIELRNSTDYPVDLTNSEFIEGIHYRFGVESLTRLEPRGHLLLVKNRAAFEHRYGAGLPVAGEFIDTQLSDDGEQIVWVDARGNVLIDFTYNDRFPWPESADGVGKTLVLSDLSADADLSDPFNWRASRTDGGSPAEDETESEDPYELWVVTQFPGTAGNTAITGPAADPDGDGFANLLEYGFGSNPMDADSTPQWRLSGPSALSFRQNAGLPDGAITLEVSEDLHRWSPLNPESTDATPQPDGSLSMTLQLSRPTGRILFIRLRVTKF